VDLRRLGTTEPSVSTDGPGLRRVWRVWLPLIALAVAVLAVSGYVVRRRLALRATNPAGKVMLAVLPFENLSADPDQEYFSDGMTEEMIAQIARIAPHDLGVIARTSAMHYKGSQKRIDEIGRELGAQYILEGSVRRGSGRVRITAQLIQVVDQTHLWAESYERDLAGVLAIQVDVARRIARSLTLELLPAAQARLAGARPIDPQAHEAYLKGLYFLNTRDPEKIALAIEQLERAVSLDPTYALAYAALGDACGVKTQHGILSSRGEEEALAQKSSAAIRKAYELDPDLAETHLMLAEDRWSTFDWPGAEEEYVRAIQLNPNNALAHHYYATFLATMRRFDEAQAENEKALQVDPLAPATLSDLAAGLARLDRDDEAIKKWREALALSPEFAMARRALALFYLKKGMMNEAVAEFSTYLVSRREGEDVPALERAIESGGPKGYHCWNLQRVKKLSKRQYVSPVDLAADAAGCGLNDEAVSWLEKAYAVKDWQLFRLGGGPAFDDLRSNPRFRDLLRRLRLPTD
jgi:adenylate cyclase